VVAWVQHANWLSLSLAVTGFFAASTFVVCALGFALERLPIPRIWNLPLDPGQLRHELIGNVVFVAVTSACFVLAFGSGVARYAEPAPLANTATFLGLMLGFQVYYYFLHRAPHSRRWVRFHRWHHVSRVTTPLSAQSMSWIETLGWAVGYCALPLLVSQWLPVSLPAWVAYMFFNMLGNITGHANVELLPKLPSPRRFAWSANPSVFHALHHARWTGHYGFQSVAMDRLCKTEWSDWPALHARIGDRRPLDSLRAHSVIGAVPK
jgi:lathosterol oxidase